MANKGRLTTGIFCLFLAGLLAWHIALPDRARSETENRTLAQFPDFSLETLKNGSFTEGMEDYFADQFPLRDDWTGLKARCEQLLGKREFNGVYLCGDTLIAKVDEPDRLQVEKNLDYVKRFGEMTEGRVLLGLIPSAAEVWKDRLPQGAPSFDQAAFIQNAAEKTGLPTVDLLGALTEHAGSQPVSQKASTNSASTLSARAQRFARARVMARPHFPRRRRCAQDPRPSRHRARSRARFAPHADRGAGRRPPGSGRDYDCS